MEEKEEQRRRSQRVTTRRVREAQPAMASGEASGLGGGEPLASGEASGSLLPL